MGEYVRAYNTVEENNKRISTLNEDFENDAVCQIKTDIAVSALRKHNAEINQCLDEIQASLQALMMRPQDYQKYAA